MEPLATFILSTASGIVANVLSHMITTRKAMIRKEEVEKEVAVRLLRQQPPGHIDSAVLANRIMREIEIISSRHPDLSVTAEQIELRRPRGRLAPFPGKKKEETIKNRLKSLGEVVAQRRKEILLEEQPATFEEPTSDVTPSGATQPSGKLPTVEMTAVVQWGSFPEPTITRARSRILSMVERIEERRSKTRMSDDE